MGQPSVMRIIIGLDLRWLSSLSGGDIVAEIGYFLLFQILSNVYIDVHGCCDICMTQDRLDYLQTNTGLTEPCCEAVSENVAGEVRKQNEVRIIIDRPLVQDLIITVSHDSVKHTVEDALVQDIAVLIEKDEVSVFQTKLPAGRWHRTAAV